MYFKSSSQRRPPAFLPGARKDGCVPLHAWNHSDGVAFFFFSSLRARRSFLSHVRWGALLLCARVNSLPRTTTPFLFFCFFFFCSYLMIPFFSAKHSQLVPGWVCTRSRRPSGAPTPFLFFLYIIIRRLFFNYFSFSHFKAMFLFRWTPNLADMQAAFADVGAIGTHTLGCRNAHNGHAHTRTHFFTPTRAIRHGCHGKCTPEIQPEKLWLPRRPAGFLNYAILSARGRPYNKVTAITQLLHLTSNRCWSPAGEKCPLIEGALPLFEGWLLI